VNSPTPTEIKLHQQSHILEIAFDDGSHFNFPCEFLRVYSPSAEVRGHGPGQETLQLDKEDVNIVEIAQVGNYAIQPTFSDGHTTGIFSWEELYNLGTRQNALWQEYLAQLKAAGHERRETKAN